MTGNWTVIEAAPVASLRCGSRISLPGAGYNFQINSRLFLILGRFPQSCLKHYKNISMNNGQIYKTELAWLWGSKDDQNMAECSAAPLLCSPSLLCLLPDLRLCIINIGGKLAKVLEIENWRPIFISLLAPWARVIQLSLLLLELETKVKRRFAKFSQSRRRPILGPFPGWRRLLADSIKTLC